MDKGGQKMQYKWVTVSVMKQPMNDENKPLRYYSNSR